MESNFKIYDELFDNISQPTLEQTRCASCIRSLAEGRPPDWGGLDEQTQEIFYRFVWLVFVRGLSLRKDLGIQLHSLLEAIQKGEAEWADLKKEMIYTEVNFGRTLIPIHNMTLKEIKYDLLCFQLQEKC